MLSACNGDKTVPPPLTETGNTSPIFTVHDDEASVIALSNLPWLGDPQGGTLFLGMFVETRRSVLNLAQCVASSSSFCVEQIPLAPGSSVVATSFDPSLLDDLATRNVGSPLTLGDWSADYVRDRNSGLGYYYSFVSNTKLPDGPVGLSFPGDDWDGHDGADELAPPTKMNVLSPDPMVDTDFFSNAPIHLEWEPGDSGGVYLYAKTPVAQTLYYLEDTGSYDLDLHALHLSNGDQVDLILGRWAVTNLDLDGNSVNVEIQSNQSLRGTWRTIGSRDDFYDLYDECIDAETAPSAVPGNYHGDLRGSTADLDPGPTGCTGHSATGIDAVVPIDLQPDDLLTVNYQLVSDDASLYLVTDCEDVDTCLDGRDATGKGDVEQVSYYNDSGGPLRVYAVLDSFAQVTDFFNLDIYIDSLGGDVLVPTCVDAIAQGPAPSGSYHGSMAGFPDFLEPDCAGAPIGAEGMTQVLLQPGETLSADVETPSGDPRLYLLSNCAIGDSCVLAKDASTDTKESIVYVNGTTSSQYLYLVVDGATDLGDYFLDITIQ
jgi:hypothetical protein